MEAGNTVAPALPLTLEQVAHTQSNTLYDVVALLAAIADGVEARSSPRADDELHHLQRLAQIAQRQVNGVIDAFDPYI